jgi:hypothetical protein
MDVDSEERERIIDQVADEIVETLLSSTVDDSKRLKRGRKGKIKGGKTKRLVATDAPREHGLDKKNLIEIAKLKNRMVAMENRADKYVKNFRIAAIEAGRLVSEKAEEAREENEQLLMNLQDQIEDLRTVMIKLSSNVKRLSGE